VHDLAAVGLRELARLRSIGEALQYGELSAKNALVEIKGLFGVAGEVEVNVCGCHGVGFVCLRNDVLVVDYVNLIELPIVFMVFAF
jgi:hypothetical protein